MFTKEGQPIGTIENAGEKLKLPPGLYFEPEILLSVLSPVIPDPYELKRRAEEKYDLLIKKLGLQIERNHQQPLFWAADDDDLIGIYLVEIGRYPILTFSQEQILAQMIEEGKRAILHLKESKSPLRPNDFIEVILNGNAARNFFADCNLHLVVNIARKYTNRGLSFLDLIQEGSVWLIPLVEKYDWRRGYRFSTYATPWIRKGINQAIARQVRTIRIPDKKLDLINHLKRTSNKLKQELGREPTPEEIGEELDIDPDGVREMFKISQETLSFETLLPESLPLETSLSVEETVIQEDGNTKLRKAIASLPDKRQKEALEMKFGLGNTSELTCEEIGRVFGVTRQGAWRMEQQALRRLQSNKGIKDLRDSR